MGAAHFSQRRIEMIHPNVKKDLEIVTRLRDSVSKSHYVIDGNLSICFDIPIDRLSEQNFYRLTGLRMFVEPQN